jgi:hypothetical protein
MLMASAPPCSLFGERTGAHSGPQPDPFGSGLLTNCWSLLSLSACVQGLHLPFAFMAVTVLMGGPWQADLLGILAGHM